MKLHWLAWLMAISLVVACEKPVSRAKPINAAANAAGSGAAAVAASGSPAVGSMAPEIEGKDLSGVSFKLSDYRGKVVVLDFWGNW